MTIIERALNKHRPTPTLNPGKRQRTAPGRTLDPNLRIARHAAKLDRDACRERRLLLSAETDDEKSYVAAYRMLRTRLLHRARNSNWTTIAVTSAGPNDGKTLTTINLALSLAREKSRDIVLLDLDMRNPSVCRALGVHPKHELRDFLERGQALDDLFFTVGSDNLLIAGSVTPTDTASELLASTVFDDLLMNIRRGTVDPVIIIDLPPILVTDDALVVAPKIDAVLLVASEGSTSRSDLEKALQLVSEFPVAGLVLNRASETSADYNYAYEAESDAGTS